MLIIANALKSMQTLAQRLEHVPRLQTTCISKFQRRTGVALDTPTSIARIDTRISATCRDYCIPKKLTLAFEGPEFYFDVTIRSGIFLRHGLEAGALARHAIIYFISEAKSESLVNRVPVKTPLCPEIQYVSLFEFEHEGQTDGVEMRLNAAASGYCDDERRLAATIVVLQSKVVLLLLL